MKDTRTASSRAGQVISGASLINNLTIKADPAMISMCVAAGLFHVGRRDKPNPSLSMWIYIKMVEALGTVPTLDVTETPAPSRYQYHPGTTPKPKPQTDTNTSPV